MDRKEKVENLKKISDQLKSEFVGISDIIDRIIETISPWYITPEIIERPVVVSLWGLTGTGKTSVVRRLISLLNLESDSLFFDCGVNDCSDHNIQQKIDSYFVNDDTDSCPMDPEQSLEGYEIKNPKKSRFRNFVFVFDEFQYARTIDEEGQEVDKSAQRCIWNLIDNGILDFQYQYYNVKNLRAYTTELENLYINGNIQEDTRIKNHEFPEDVMDAVSEVTCQYRDYNDNDMFGNDNSKTDREMAKLDRAILPITKKRTLVSTLNTMEPRFGNKVWEELGKCTVFYDYIEKLKKYIKLLCHPKKIDCSGSLIFILGNLDEAFTGVCNDIDPDVDADIFSRISSDVSILDIKEALGFRFRQEQIGRIGNNIIIYPSLKKEDFKEVIRRETDKVVKKYNDLYKISISFTDNFKNLIYYEGVYPSQGVRPIMTTINSLCLSKLSKIIELDLNNVVLDCDQDLNKKEISSYIKDKDGNILYTFTDRLGLGKLRDVTECSKTALHSVHETGHAILLTYINYEIPDMILSLASNGGGYTYGEIERIGKRKQGAISKSEIDKNIMIDLAGYVAEHIMYPPERCTTGCMADLTSAWNTLRNAVYNGGYFYPIPYASNGNELASGLPDNEEPTNSVLADMKQKFEELRKKTEDILVENKTLLVEISKYLVEKRCMFPETYKEYVSKYGSPRLKEILENLDEIRETEDNYYLSVLKG